VADMRSTASAERVNQVVELADRYSSILDAFKRPLAVTREVEQLAPGQG
jgi:hypothetical protein